MCGTLFIQEDDCYSTYKEYIMEQTFGYIMHVMGGAQTHVKSDKKDTCAKCQKTLINSTLVLPVKV